MNKHRVRRESGHYSCNRKSEIMSKVKAETRNKIKHKKEDESQGEITPTTSELPGGWDMVSRETTGQSDRNNKATVLFHREREFPKTAGELSCDRVIRTSLTY